MRKKLPLLRRLAIILIALSQLAGFGAAHALTHDDTFYNGNNIFFYDPDYTNAASCGGASAPGSGITGSVTDLKPDETLKTIFQDLLNGGMNAVQAAAVMGNMYTESYNYINQTRFDPNFYEGGVQTATDGYGLVQWSFDRRTQLFDYAQQQNEPVSSIGLQIKFLLKEYNDTYKTLLSGTAFDSGTNVTDATIAWMKIYENPLQKPGDPDPAKINSERIPAANKIYGFYGGLAPTTAATSSAATSTGCGTSATGSGSTSAIVQYALKYAWPSPIANGKTQESDATPAYQQARPQWDTEGDWSGCDVFVATVMRSSGTDPNYAGVSVHLQKQYVESHPNLYKIINNPTQSDLQPGDILLSDSMDGSGGIGHTVIYIGSKSNQGGYPVADASDGDRVPSLRPVGSDALMISENSIIARYIGGGA